MKAGQSKFLKRSKMKYVCLGYLDVKKWGSYSQAEQNDMIDACLTYDEVLQKNGHWAGGEGLGGPDSTTTLRYQNGRVAVMDGPFVETKEVLGGLLIIEAPDLNRAVQMISNHPGVKMGAWEIRPAADLTPMIEESKRRRAAKGT
jgi:hypothetical protein